MTSSKLLVTALLISLSAQAAARLVPVMIETNGELDACALGKVTGITTFLAVRAGPATSYAQVDSLYTDDFVLLCSASPDGEWLGVVYTSGRKEPVNCGTSDRSVGSQPYRGPCTSGWVHGKWVTVVAG